MTKPTRYGWTANGVAALVILIDQAVKGWILGLGLRFYETRPVAGLLQFTLVPNFGVSYGLLKAQSDVGRWALVGISLLVAALIVWWARRSTRALQALGYGLV